MLASLLPDEMEQDFVWCCQTNANGSPKSCHVGSSRQQLTPVGEGRVSEILEAGAAFEGAIVVEMVVDGCVGGGRAAQAVFSVSIPYRPAQELAGRRHRLFREQYARVRARLLQAGRDAGFRAMAGQSLRVRSLLGRHALGNKVAA